MTTVDEKMVIVLKLVEHVFYDVWPFLIFYIFSLFIFGFCYRVLGVDPDEIDDDGLYDEGAEYGNVPVLTKYFMHSFRNSIGDVASPQSQYWIER